MKLTLDHRVLTIAPVSFEMPQGRLKPNLRLDARKAVPVTDLDVRLTDMRLEEFAGPAGRAVAHLRDASARANCI